MTIDDWRARYDHLNAETDRLRAEVERLREDAARARWCEEAMADVCYLGESGEWTVWWEVSRTRFAHKINRDRNAAIDAAMKGGK